MKKQTLITTLLAITAEIYNIPDDNINEWQLISIQRDIDKKLHAAFKKEEEAKVDRSEPQPEQEKQPEKAPDFEPRKRTRAELDEIVTSLIIEVERNRQKFDQTKEQALSDLRLKFRINRIDADASYEGDNLVVALKKSQVHKDKAEIDEKIDHHAKGAQDAIDAMKKDGMPRQLTNMLQGVLDAVMDPNRICDCPACTLERTIAGGANHK